MSARPPFRSSIPRSSVGGLAVLVGVALGSADAAGAEPAAAATPEPASTAAEQSPEQRWYGYQTLLADGGALAIAIAAAATNDRSTGQGILVAAAAAYAIGGPIVHLAHARGGASLASLGVRVGAPLAGALLGMGLAALAPDDDGDEYVIGTALGLLGGVAGAVALDATLLAWEPEAAAASRLAGGWRPALLLARGRLQLGLVDVF